MRPDTCGLFWDDTPPPKPPKKEKIKRLKPYRYWEEHNYLPHFETASKYVYNLYSDDELYSAGQKNEVLIFDIECYTNYFLIAFKNPITKKIVYFDKTPEEDTINYGKLYWVLNHFCIIGFNSRNYDIILAALAVNKKSNQVLKNASDSIIQEGIWGHQILRSYKTKKLESDHIDLIEVAPLKASLKIYGGRLHTKRMQDLPLLPETILTADQITIMRWYCIIDLNATIDLYNEVKEAIDLREKMSKEYGIDLRSRSDAQVAEYVISSEVSRLNFKKAQKPYIAPGTSYKYQIPAFIQYSSPLMNWALDIVRNANFVVSEFGNVGMPKELSDLKLNIGNSIYRMGIGGLHSSEKQTCHKSDEDFILIDRDVTSYYPYIILLLKLFPAHLGTAFLKVYEKLVNKRIAAKKAGHKLIADSLKITINGSFGKLGSRYSTLYSPNLLIQVTLTGQLTLLMLIERIELRGIEVVSANTDGIVIKCPRKRQLELESLIDEWEQDTGFNTEETIYSALYSRDVNNYIAVKEEGDIKCKGAFAKATLQKNPTNEICIDAIKDYLTSGYPIEQTIVGCQDITKFISVRQVKGGAIEAFNPDHDIENHSETYKRKMAIRSGWVEEFGGWIKQEWKLLDNYDKMVVGLDFAYLQSSLIQYGEYLGKAVRWYYSSSKTEDHELVYSISGNKVPRSEEAKPIMEIPEEFPFDINYDWYIKECYDMLNQVGITSSSLEAA